MFKEYDGTIINLNPYSAQDDTFTNVPLYIYILPEYVRDSNGILIDGSQQSTTLRYSFDTSIFDPLNPIYDPTAIQLGIIYITTDFDSNNLNILDTRRRGGGVEDGISDDILTSVIAEAFNYWDVSYATGMSYQTGGYVVIRLPETLKNVFTEQEISAVIRKNLTAGVQFSIEDTNGNDW